MSWKVIRCLMAVACSVGVPEKPTPKGSFTIYSKQEHKRSGSYGFSVQGNTVVPSEGGGPGRYVGYPMGYWCEFAPAYGFHQGYVHPHPRTHGCIRLHGEAAAKFYALVRYRHAREHFDDPARRTIRLVRKWCG